MALLNLESFFVKVIPFSVSLMNLLTDSRKIKQRIKGKQTFAVDRDTYSFYYSTGFALLFFPDSNRRFPVFDTFLVLLEVLFSQALEAILFEMFYTT